MHKWQLVGFELLCLSLFIFGPSWCTRALIGWTCRNVMKRPSLLIMNAYLFWHLPKITRGCTFIHVDIGFHELHEQCHISAIRRLVVCHDSRSPFRNFWTCSIWMLNRLSRSCKFQHTLQAQCCSPINSSAWTKSRRCELLLEACYIEVLGI